MKTNLLITTILLAATCGGAMAERVNTERRVILRHEYIVAWISGANNDGGHSFTTGDDGVGVSIIHSASCTNAAHAPTIVTQSCQRTHCDTPAPMPMPWGFTNQHPIITLPYIVGTNDTIYRWMNQPNTWPGTYSNYVTNINANVEKEN